MSYPQPYNLGFIRTDRGEFKDAGNQVFDVTNPRWVGGAKGDGITDDTAAIVACFAAAHAQAGIVFFPPALTFLTDPITIDATNYPYGVMGHNATIKARASSANPLVTIEMPTNTFPAGFFFTGLTLNANNLHASALKLHGCQHAILRNLKCFYATGDNVVLAGASGYGIYWNEFAQILSYGSYGGVGFSIKSTGAANYIASNNWLGCASQQNDSYGWDIDYASGTYVGCEAENNGAAAWNIDNTLNTDIFGGYTEANPTGANVTVAMTANSYGVKLIGGRHVGYATSGTISATRGNVLLPSTESDVSATFGYNGTNLNLVGGIAITTGMRLDGGAPVDNMIGFDSAAIGSIGLGSTGYLWFNPTGALLQAKKKFTADLGIGVGNSAAGSSLGTVVKKVQIFDETGASIGYLPVYDEIT